jgi:two-component system chemotaxis response regulator CheY
LPNRRYFDGFVAADMSDGACSLPYDFSTMDPEGRLVLVVEDEDAIREVMTDVLEDRGFRVMSARNGAEALQHLDSARPDAVVLDLLMPVMHGWAFMETYYERTGGAAIPIVVVSVNPALPRSFNRFGVRHIIGKPFNINDLLDAVQDATGTAAA